MALRLTFLYSFFLLTGTLCAQSETQIVEAFGIDILPAFIALGGGTNSFDEVELIYRINTEQDRQLRLKLNINNRAIINEEIVFSSETDQLPCGEIIPKMMNTYTPSQNIQVAAGLAKYMPNSKFPLYYGLDINMGVNRGNVESIRQTCGMNDTLLVNSIKEHKAYSYLLGVTPVLGTELSLNRLTLIIEFGFAANYNFGKHPYLDEESNEREIGVSRLDFILNRFLNDFAILYRF